MDPNKLREKSTEEIEKEKLIAEVTQLARPSYEFARLWLATSCSSTRSVSPAKSLREHIAGLEKRLEEVEPDIATLLER